MRKSAAMVTAGVLGLAGLGITTPLVVASAATPEASSPAASPDASTPAPAPSGSADPAAPTPPEDAPSAEDRAAERLAAIKEALAGLVSDGTLTQEQADKVAETLSADGALGPGPGGPGGHGGGHGPGVGPFELSAAANALGMTEEELRTALAVDGATLASIAEDQGVDEATLVSALTTAAKEQIAQAVTDGRLTQDEADELLADLPDKITDLITRELPGPGGPGGMGGMPGHGIGDRGPSGEGTTEDGTGSASESSATPSTEGAVVAA